ncbi:hypothetical protein [Pseudoduganella rhizocola]|uniref:hypothetical protein n=1 Tax=Pseudoduganella rhizocola TaxID=3382643 RepID=UPI0038B4A3BB
MKPSSIALAIALALSASPAVTAAPQSADAQFRAIHQQEWKWRQSQHLEDDEDDTEAIRGDLPRVDAATQLARQRYWEGVLKKAGWAAGGEAVRRGAHQLCRLPRADRRAAGEPAVPRI